MAQSQNTEKVTRFPAPPAHDEATPAPTSEATVAEAAAPVAAKPAKKRSLRPVILSGVGIVALIAAGWFGYNWFTTGRFIISTDDAYVGGDIATISSKLAGYVASVDVVANEAVKKGDPLVTLDDGDYTIARDQAQAAMDTQNLTLSRINAQIGGAQAAVDQANAQKQALIAAQKNAALAQQRAAQLQQTSVGSQATLDQANAALDQANANLTAGDAQIEAATANIAVLKGQLAEAGGQLKSLGLARDKAVRDLSFTVLRAPYDGVVGNLSVQTGDLVSAGAHLASLVPTGALYVDANFKETQLGDLVPGEKVTVQVDALDGQAFTGTIQSLAPASGSVFSLLPAENATGNFTKVVQRVPVRIALPADALASGKFRAGLSVVVEVDTRSGSQN
ncbi:MAG TPA: HlyD family secretion protein [Devosia sp.]|nr:HlyD family secretion protein [Devosia sp.]